MEINNEDLKFWGALVGWGGTMLTMFFGSGRALEKRDQRIKMLEAQFTALCKKFDRFIDKHEADHDLLIAVSQKLDDIHGNCVVRPKVEQ